MSEVKAVYAWEELKNAGIKVGLSPYLDKGAFQIKDREDRHIQECLCLEDLAVFIKGYAKGFESGRKMKS